MKPVQNQRMQKYRSQLCEHGVSFSLVLESCWGPHVLGHQARDHWWQYSHPSWTRSRSPAKKEGQSLGSPMIFTHDFHPWFSPISYNTFLNPYQIDQEKCGHHGSRHPETPSVIQLGKMAGTCPRPSLCLMATTAGPTVSTTLVTCSFSWICHQPWRMKAEEQATLEYASERSASSLKIPHRKGQTLCKRHQYDGDAPFLHNSHRSQAASSASEELVDCHLNLRAGSWRLVDLILSSGNCHSSRNRI